MRWIAGCLSMECAVFIGDTMAMSSSSFTSFLHTVKLVLDIAIVAVVHLVDDVADAERRSETHTHSF